MITKVSSAYFLPKSATNFNVNQTNNGKVATFPVNNSFKNNVSKTSPFALANSISFAQGSLARAFKEMSLPMRTCYDVTTGNGGQEAGLQYNVSSLVDRYSDDLPNFDDAIKTTIPIEQSGSMITDSRTQLKKLEDGIIYEMTVRQPRNIDEALDISKPFQMRLGIIQTPRIQEKAYVLNTKGKLMAVIEDGKNIIITNAGKITKKSNSETLKVNVENNKKGTFFEFIPPIQSVEQRTPMPSIGEGTDIVIGLENGRFVAETIADIEDFINKVNNEEIVLKQFIANPKAKDTQFALLAGGYSTRAEYANAASPAIFHGELGGAQTTKGIFKNATGLSPMAMMFIQLHNAGFLDCSKGKIKIGDNIKLYLNKSGKNNGNGGFTLDLYKKMAREGRKSLSIVPNDPISNLVVATKEMEDLMSSGKAAMVMIAKKINADDAKGKFGIMKLDEDNRILEFAEKPKEIPEGYTVDGDKCLTNTFQFAVSQEAFDVLYAFEKFMPSNNGKDLRDWSKHFVPILKTLTELDDNQKIRENITAVLGSQDYISDRLIDWAKNKLHGQRIYAVPTDEPWADCGSFDDLMHTTMQIAAGNFEVEDFAREHLLNSINTKTGLVASSPEQLAKIEHEYETLGEVMVVPIAKYVNPRIVQEYINSGLIEVNSPE